MRNNKYSDFKIAHFPEKLQSFAEDRITAPIYVRVKPINRCDHSCFFCCYSTGFRKGDKDNHIISGMHTDMVEHDTMPRAKMMEVLEDFHEMGVRAVTYSGGGEPLLHPDIVEFMQQTLDYGIDLSIITNGQALVKRRAEVLAHAKWVRVSIDYASADQMVKSRNVPDGHFQMVLRNLADFANIKSKDCDLGVNFIVHKENYRDIAVFTRTLKRLGVNNVRVSPMWTPDYVKYHEPIAGFVRQELEKCRELIGKGFTINTTYNISLEAHSPKRTYHKCYIMQTVPVIGADQNVYACHNTAYSPHGVVGSIKNQRFKEMWFSERTRDVFASFNPAAVCNHQCAADRKNKIIHDMLDASTDNFV